MKEGYLPGCGSPPEHSGDKEGDRTTKWSLEDFI